MKSGTRRHIVLAFLLPSAALCSSARGETVNDMFACKANSPGSQWITVRAADGILETEVPGTDRMTSQGTLEVTPEFYIARKKQPVTSDGQGLATSRYTVNRRTGTFRFEMNATAPGRPPFNTSFEGVCNRLDPPGASDGGSPSTAGATQPTIAASGGGSVGQAPVAEATVEEEPTAPAHAASDEEAQRLEAQAEKERVTEWERRRIAAERLARDEFEAEQARKEEELRLAREQVESERKRKEAEDLAAREKAKTQAKQLAGKQRRRDESMLRETFNAQATSCPGGGSGILYLRTSKPPRLGCNVTFEARCVGAASGSVVNFGQNNYIGGSCLGIGDPIRIGQMSCPAEQVQIVMTSATCS